MPAARRCGGCAQFRRTDASILNPKTGERVSLGQCLSSRALANRVFSDDGCDAWEPKGGSGSAAEEPAAT